jgi:hypothetical protein
VSENGNFFHFKPFVGLGIKIFGYLQVNEEIEPWGITSANYEKYFGMRNGTTMF